MSENLAHQEQSEAGVHHPPSNTKTIWRTFWILLFITIFEITIGIIFQEPKYKPALKLIFIGLTVVKAYYIVGIFMHMKYETKFFSRVILLPFIMFILYLIFIALYEAVKLDAIHL